MANLVVVSILLYHVSSRRRLLPSGAARA